VKHGLTSGLPAAATPSGRPGEKGLRGNALGFLWGVVIGVASTAPGYSLAAALGLVAAQVGYHAPAVMILAFVPMLLIATTYYWLNRADPDCGTTFSWVTRAMGPWAGWLGGWGIVVSCIIVMANLAEIASLYTYHLIGVEVTSEFAILAVGCAWIALMTWICYIGIETSARTQWLLLAAEVVTLVLFAAVALVKVATMDIAGEAAPSLDWINPFAIDSWGDSLPG
jgi:amino acid transporter